MTHQNNVFKIKTKQLILRCFLPEDAQSLKNLVDSSLAHLRPFMPWANAEPLPLKAKEEMLRGWIGQFYKNEDFPYAVCNLNNELIGSCGLHTRRGKGILEIGYWIGAKHINKGYATELSYALTKVAIEHCKVEKVEIRNEIDNLASIRIPEKLNYTKDAVITTLHKNLDGSRKKHIIWNLFQEDFIKMPQYEPIQMFDVMDKLINPIS